MSARAGRNRPPVRHVPIGNDAFKLEENIREIKRERDFFR
jgi:hypothetical protein